MMEYLELEVDAIDEETFDFTPAANVELESELDHEDATSSAEKHDIVITNVRTQSVSEHVIVIAPIDNVPLKTEPWTEEDNTGIHGNEGVASSNGTEQFIIHSTTHQTEDVRPTNTDSRTDTVVPHIQLNRYAHSYIH